MIQDEEQLRIVNEQLGRAQSALVSLRKTVLPVSAAKYDLISENYLDEIIRLRSEIDAYLGLESAYAQQPYLVVALDGQGVTLGKTRSSLVSHVLKGFQNALKSLLSLSGDYEGIPRQSRQNLVRACDPAVLGLLPGSIRLLIAEPEFGETETTEETIYGETVDLFLQGVEMIECARSKNRNGQNLPDRVRRAVFSAVLKVSPPSNGNLEKVEFGGRAVRKLQLAPLSKASTLWLKQEIRRLDAVIAQQQPQRHTFEGTIRRLNLDDRTFLLRQELRLPHSVSFTFDDSQKQKVTALVDQRVSATGLEVVGRGSRSKLQLTALQPLDAR
jgi:hypothetical protein